MIGKLQGRLMIVTIRNQLAKNPKVYDSILSKAA
jgi:hypothetical protein